MNTNEIQFYFQKCESIQELIVTWDNVKKYITNENKSHLIEVKEMMKEYLCNLKESNIEKDKLNEWWKKVLKMPKSEKMKLLDFNNKKLKYYGTI